MTSLNYIFENHDDYLNKFREMLIKHNKLYCDEKIKAVVHPESLKIEWYEIVDLDLKNLNIPNKFIQIYVPQSEKIKGQYTFNLFEERLALDWKKYFKKLKESYLKTPEINKFLERLKECIDYSKIMLEEAKKEKLSPLIF